MFNGKKIESLEQSVATLTEDSTRANETITTLNNTIESLFENIEEIVGELRIVKSEKDELEKTFNNYATEIKSLKNYINELENRYSSVDVEHNTQIEKLIKKCEELQLSNVQIMNQHNDMIKRYEESIKAYAEQTQNMKDNILKKMNAKNIISVVEE